MTSASNIQRRAVFATLALTVGLAACQGEQDFTRQPAQTVSQQAISPIKTTVFVSNAIPAADLVLALDQRLPTRLTGISRRLSRAACVERNGRTRCGTARVRGEITRTDPPRLIGTARGLTLAIPARYKLRARGTGSARTVNAEVAGTLTVNVDFDVDLDENWRHQVSYRAPVRLKGNASPKLLDRKIELDAAFARGFARRMAGLRRIIETRLNTSAPVDHVDLAWRNLHYPVLLTAQPKKWLRGDPQSLGFGGLAIADGQLHSRIAIRGGLALYSADRPVPLIARERPSLSAAERRPGTQADENEKAKAPPQTELIVPVALPYEEIAGRMRTAFAAKGPIADSLGGKSVTITVEDIKLFPSNNRVAIALRLTVRTEGAWRDLSGTAYLMGTPALIPNTGRLGLRFVDFTAPRSTPALFDNGRFILPERVFASVAQAGFDMDLKDRFGSVLPDVNGLMDVPFAEKLRLKGRFADLGIHAVTPADDALRIALTAQGTLSVEAPTPALVDLNERETVSTSQ